MESVCHTQLKTTLWKIPEEQRWMQFETRSSQVKVMRWQNTICSRVTRTYDLPGLTFDLRITREAQGFEGSKFGWPYAPICSSVGARIASPWYEAVLRSSDSGPGEGQPLLLTTNPFHRWRPFHGQHLVAVATGCTRFYHYFLRLSMFLSTETLSIGGTRPVVKLPTALCNRDDSVTKNMLSLRK